MARAPAATRIQSRPDERRIIRACPAGSLSCAEENEQLARALPQRRLQRSSPVEDEVEKDDEERRRTDEQQGGELEGWIR